MTEHTTGGLIAALWKGEVEARNCTNLFQRGCLYAGHAGSYEHQAAHVRRWMKARLATVNHEGGMDADVISAALGIE